MLQTPFWATVCETVRPTLSDRCLSVMSVLSVLSVCDVGVLWPNGWTEQDDPSCPNGGWIKMPLGIEIGLDLSDIVLDGDPAPLPKRGQSHPIFGPCLLWPNGCMDQGANWYRGRPRPRPHYARWGPSSLPKKGAQPCNFRPMPIVPKQLDGWRCRFVRR